MKTAEGKELLFFRPKEYTGHCGNRSRMIAIGFCGFHPARVSGPGHPLHFTRTWRLGAGKRIFE